MALRQRSLETKERILSVCVRLFLEQGYHRTTVGQILKEAGVSASTFQHIFRSKDGVLSELVSFMFNSQFAAAKSFDDVQITSPVFIYAVETAIQLTLTEINDNIRDMYIEAYTSPETSKYIHEHTAVELKTIFGHLFPGYTDNDFYELEVGSAGMMRGYMVKKCDIHFPLEKKLECFLSLSLRAYRVSEDEINAVVERIKKLDVRVIAQGILDRLFEALEMRFNFSLTSNTDQAV